MAQINNLLRYFAVYLNGVGYMGEAEDVKLPELKIKREEFRGGGMDIPVDVDLGMEKLETEFKLFSYDPMVFRRFGLLGQFARTPLTFRGHLEGQDGVTQGVKINMDVRIMENIADNWQAGEKASVTVRCAVDFYEYIQNERVLIRIDPLGFHRVIDGVDQMLEARINLGLLASSN